MLSRLGRWCHNHRLTVVLVWAAALVVLGVAMGAKGTNYSSQFSLPNVESKHGFDILDQRFGGAGGGWQAQIVFQAPQGVTDPSVQQPMQAYFDQVAQIPDVRVTSPYSPQGARQISQQGAQAGKIAYASLELPRQIGQSKAHDIAKEIQGKAPSLAGVRIEFGGQVFQDFKPPSSETLGLAFAIFILIIAFGSVLAMGLPVGTAIAGILAGTAIIGLLSNVMKMPEFTSTLALMIGLGVGIDYALFIVTRYREGLHHGMPSDHATAVAINTAGRAVLFAGTTVVISLLGMLIMRVSFVSGLGIGAAVVVLCTMAASITLLPAILGFARERIEVTRWRGIIAVSLVAIGLVFAGFKVRGLFLVCLALAVVVLVAAFAFAPLRREVPRRRPKPVDRTLPYRWSRTIQNHPWPAVIIGFAALLLLATPMLSLRLGFSDTGNDPTSSTTRQAYDLLAEGFGPGFNGPLVLVSEMPNAVTPAELQAVTEAIQKTPGVASASPAVTNSAKNAVLWQVYPTTSPQDQKTTELVHRLRSDTLPAATQGTGLKVAVTGQVAVNVDFSDYLSQRLPWFFGVVLLLSFLLLMTVFRSVLVPLKAVVMNLISIGAAYGLVTAVFSWGWGKDLIGIGKAGPIEPFVPMMMFAIVFGLSMDYEVFLLSRIKEEYDRHHDNAKAVADGLAATARVITAAAAIMVFVFGSFLLDNNRIIKLFGMGLASAVLIDATVVRMLLVPATMELLGDRNWWLPKWLDRILPKIDVEGTGHDTVSELEGEEPVTVSL